MGTPEATVRAYFLSERVDLVRTVLSCADAVTTEWEGDATPDRDQVVPPMRACLDRAGIREALPEALAGGVAATGRELPADPVAASPYVTVTSRGPVLRATLRDFRLVVTIHAFDVKRGCNGAQYVRGPRDPREAVEVERRGA